MTHVRSTRGRIGAALTALAISVTGVFALPSPASAACPTLGPSARWISPFTIGGTGSNWAEGFFGSSGTNVTGYLTRINGSTQPTNQIIGTLDCNEFTGTLTGVANAVTEVEATLRDNGDEFVDGTWSNSNGLSGTWSSARVLQEATADDATELTTDPDSSGATPTEPVQVGVTSPTVGDLAIATGHAANPVLAGYQLLDQVVHIEAPPATPEDPLVFRFVLDASTLLGAPAGEVAVLRNGQPAGNCQPDSGTAAIPNPCVAGRVTLPGGDVEITVRTASASIWAFGVNASRGGFRILNSVLPNARLGQAYSLTLGAVGGTTPYKWKKVTKLPKGLKLKARTGVLSGIPKKVTGTFVVRIMALDKAKPRRTTTKTFTIRVT